VALDRQRQFVGDDPATVVDDTDFSQATLGNADIDLSGATNPVEFFAVISEYFFERPDLLRSNHPGLFELLQRIYRTST